VDTNGRTTSSNASPVSSRARRMHRDSFAEDMNRKNKRSRRTNEEMRWCGSVYRELMKKQHEVFTFVFYKPVDPIALNIPTYFDVIKNPMDLSTIKKKMDVGDYETSEEFEADVRLMLNNCFTFNRPGDDVYMMGKKVEEVFDRKWTEKPIFSAHGSSSNLLSSSSKKKKRSSDSDSDGSTSSDEEYVSNKKQIRIMEQQIAFLQAQLENLRQDQRRRRRNKNKSRSRRSSKGSTVEAVPKPPKAPRPPKPKVEEVVREISFEEKRQLSEAINNLSGEKLAKVVQIIHQCMPQIRSVS
jgi:bromodomain-containing factor 1